MSAWPRRRRFEALSLATFAASGAAAGVLFGAVELALGAGLAFVAGTTLLGALAGAGSRAPSCPGRRGSACRGQTAGRLAAAARRRARR